jgi:hypothetical protein
LTRLDTALDERSLTLQQSTLTLAVPTQRLAAPLIVQLDRGGTFIETRGGKVLAYNVGQAGTAMTFPGGDPAEAAPARRLAQRRLQVALPTDGAPVVGQVRGGKAIVLAGFGPGAAFLAPALARYLAGASSTTESGYFAAREARRATRTDVADYAPPLEALA